MTSPVSMFLFMCLCMCVCVSMFRCVHIKSQLKSETACNRYFKWKITSQRKFKKYIKDFHRLSSFIWIKYADKGSSPGFTGIFYSHEKSISKRRALPEIFSSISWYWFWIRIRITASVSCHTKSYALKHEFAVHSYRNFIVFIAHVRMAHRLHGTQDTNSMWLSNQILVR